MSLLEFETKRTSSQTLDLKTQNPFQDNRNFTNGNIDVKWLNLKENNQTFLTLPILQILAKPKPTIYNKLAYIYTQYLR